MSYPENWWVLATALAIAAPVTGQPAAPPAPPPVAPVIAPAPPVAAAPTATAAPAAPLSQRLDNIFNASQWSNAHWGILVKDLETGEVVYERESNKSVMPASNMKIFTTAASLATLGEDYRFETPIYATGTTDTQGTLRGNIYIIGSGDPSISGRYLDTPTTAILDQWADAVKSRGIRRIEGDVIGDDDIFDESSVASTWSVEYMQEWYAAENSGLAINDNCWDTTFTVSDSIPGNRVKSSRNSNTFDQRRTLGDDSTSTVYLSALDPLATDYYNLSIGKVNVTKGSGSSDLTIARQPETNNVVLSGTVPADREVHEWGSIHNGTLFAATLVKEALIRKGIEVTGDAVDIDDMDKQVASHLKANPGTLIHTHVSPPISKIIAIVNKPSQNFYADMLLKVVGAKVYGEGSWTNGEKVVKDLVTTAGADARSLNIRDGSGLSRLNLVEPQQVVALLAHMHSRPDFPVFEASLPIMGIDGTLKGRMTGTAAERNVKAKTGTIGKVRSLSGYVTAANGHRLVFCMIANNFYTPTSAATEAQNKAVLELINQ